MPGAWGNIFKKLREVRFPKFVERGRENSGGDVREKIPWRGAGEKKHRCSAREKNHEKKCPADVTGKKK